MVQDAPHLPRERSRSPESSRTPTGPGSFMSWITSTACCARDRVVRIDEERGPVGMVLGERAERVTLVVERGDERVRHRAADLQVELPRGVDVRRRAEAHDRAAARRGPCGLEPVRPAEREVDEPAPLRRDHVPGGLRGDRRVQRDLVQEGGLDELGLRDRRRHLEDRLLRVDDPALGDRPDLALEPYVGEVVDRLSIEPHPAEREQLVLVEREVLEEPETVVQARGDGNPRSFGMSRTYRLNVAGPSIPRR